MNKQTLESIAKGTVLGLLGAVTFVLIQNQIPDYQAKFAKKEVVQKTWNIPVVTHGNEKAGYFSFGIHVNSIGKPSVYDEFERGTDSVLSQKHFETYLNNTEKFRNITQDSIDAAYK